MRTIAEGDILAGRYQLRNKLGSGGFSEVWRALDKKTGGKDLAIKIYSPGIALDEAGIDLFKKEFNTASQLIHSRVVVPNHYDIHDGAPFMVMPYMPNGTSIKYVRNWNEFEIKRFLKQTASALHYIHTLRNPVIHRDIKPENVLVNADGDFMLADFGISGEFAQTLRKSKAMENASACTLAFCPPEKYSKDLRQRADRPSNDIWSLGASIFELITGETPFGGNGGLVQAGGAEIPIIDNKIPKYLKRLVSWMLSADPNERPTASEVIEVIENEKVPNSLDAPGASLGYMTLAIPVLALALDYLLCEFLNPLARISLMVLSGLGLIGWIILAVRSTSAGASYFRLPGIDSELKWYDWGLSIIVSGLIVLNLFL
jgi:serine/threonine protein kinase